MIALIEEQQHVNLTNFIFIFRLDTAAVYRNETEIGECLQDLLPGYNLQRSDIFITSKLGKRLSIEAGSAFRGPEVKHIRPMKSLPTESSN